MNNIKNVIQQLIKYTIIDEQIKQELITQLNNEIDDNINITLLIEQLQNTIKYDDLQIINQPITDSIQSLKYHFDTQQGQLKLMKQSLNQIDYQSLTKASKMDIEIHQQQLNKLNQQVQEQKTQLIDITQKISNINCQIEQYIINSLAQQLHILESNIVSIISKKIDQQLTDIIQKQEKIQLNQDKLQHSLETKADQSQFAEIMQSKVNINQFHLIKGKQIEIQSHFKYLIEAVLTFFEATISETDSINMKKSDMIKSINLIKNVLIKISPNEDFKFVQQKINVKLKPTLFKTMGYQRRIKTEMSEQ